MKELRKDFISISLMSLFFNYYRLGLVILIILFQLLLYNKLIFVKKEFLFLQKKIIYYSYLNNVIELKYKFNYYNNNTPFISSVIKSVCFNSISELKQILFIVYKKSSGHSLDWVIKINNFYLLQWHSKWFNILKCFSYNELSLIFSFDLWRFQKQSKFINKLNSKKSLLWKIKNHFGCFNPYVSDFWIFGNYSSGIYLIKIMWLF